MSSYEITHVHLTHPGTHESHIASVWIRGGAAPVTVSRVVDAIHGGESFFYVVGGNRKVTVRAQMSVSGRWFIETNPDDTRQDNLLYLPKY